MGAFDGQHGTRRHMLHTECGQATTFVPQQRPSLETVVAEVEGLRRFCVHCGIYAPDGEFRDVTEADA